MPHPLKIPGRWPGSEEVLAHISGSDKKSQIKPESHGEEKEAIKTSMPIEHPLYSNPPLPRIRKITIETNSGNKVCPEKDTGHGTTHIAPSCEDADWPPRPILQSIPSQMPPSVENIERPTKVVPKTQPREFQTPLTIPGSVIPQNAVIQATPLHGPNTLKSSQRPYDSAVSTTSINSSQYATAFTGSDRACLPATQPMPLYEAKNTRIEDQRPGKGIAKLPKTSLVPGNASDGLDATKSDNANIPADGKKITLGKKLL